MTDHVVDLALTALSVLKVGDLDPVHHLVTDDTTKRSHRVHLSRGHQRSRSQFSCRLVSFASLLLSSSPELTCRSIVGGPLVFSSSKCFTDVLLSKVRIDMRHSVTSFATNPLSPTIPLRLPSARVSSNDFYARTNTNEWEVRVEPVKSNNINGSRVSIGDC